MIIIVIRNTVHQELFFVVHTFSLKAKEAGKKQQRK